MDPNASSLALGILVFVLSYSCFGRDWAFSLSVALGATIVTRIAHQAAKHWSRSTGYDSQRNKASTERRAATPRTSDGVLELHVASEHMKTMTSQCHGA